MTTLDHTYHANITALTSWIEEYTCLKYGFTEEYIKKRIALTFDYIGNNIDRMKDTI